MLVRGDPVPWFECASSVNPRFGFDTAAGRYVVVSFFGSTKLPAAAKLLAEIARRGSRFDVTNAVFFGVTNDIEDVNQLRPKENGQIFFFDNDLAVSRLFGAAARTSQTAAADRSASQSNESFRLTPTTFVLDQCLRVSARFTLTDDAEAHVQQVFDVLDAMPTLTSLSMNAPVLIVPQVLEPELCRRLIDHYEATGGTDSGYMEEVNGRTVGVIDYAHKRRMDCEITDANLIRAIHQRLSRRVVPAIKQAYQFGVTRIERNIVACYDAAQGAHFRAHRDNTTLGTAHRRFAVTLNLNSEAYEGGELWFPEFGPQKYKAPSGSAIVFSCSLLHEVPRVTSGRRYAYLPFLYDDAAAAIRQQNRKYIGDLVSASGGNPAISADCRAAGQVVDAAAEHPASEPQPDQAQSPGPTIDGRCGCGNPAGCGTCLTSATYQLPSAPGKTSGDEPKPSA